MGYFDEFVQDLTMEIKKDPKREEVKSWEDLDHQKIKDTFLKLKEAEYREKARILAEQNLIEEAKRQEELKVQADRSFDLGGAL